MIIPGLVSVTFRKLSPTEIVGLVKQAGLQAIEWGGDIHVPHGAVARAGEVRKLTLDAGLRIAAYGSYYRVGQSEHDGLSFQSVLDTAFALGAPLIRVWAGNRASAVVDAAYWKMIVDESRIIADCAASAGVSIAYEYHAKTLTDTIATTLRLLREVNHPNVHSLWQPDPAISDDENLQALQQILSSLANIHVFEWQSDSRQRRPLADGAHHWPRYLNALRDTGRDHCALIEFVSGDEPAAFLEDARTLRQWLGENP